MAHSMRGRCPRQWPCPQRRAVCPMPQSLGLSAKFPMTAAAEEFRRSPYPLIDPQPAAACLMPAGPKEPCVALDDAAAPQLLSAVRAAAGPMHVAALLLLLGRSPPIPITALLSLLTMLLPMLLLLISACMMPFSLKGKRSLRSVLAVAQRRCSSDGRAKTNAQRGNIHKDGWGLPPNQANT